MKVFIALAALVAVSSGAPRYLVIPIEDVDFGNSNLRLPVYRMPAGLARQARAAQEDQYQEPNFDAAPRLAPNPGDSWCICMWAAANLVAEAGGAVQLHGLAA